MDTVRPAEPISDKPHAFAPVFGLLKSHMGALDLFLRQQLTEFEPEIRDMADYCIDTSGKRIRPALVFLSGWKDGGAPSPELVRVAAVVELVHLATLVHDDIMDEAELRRNRRTTAREYGPTPAVLLGDALFAHALNLATQYPTTEVCREVSISMRRVCAGEIVQTLRRGSTNVNRADYQRIIDLKTAELFRVSCHLGARLGGFPDAYVEAVATFGRHLGIAYQIYDDLADYFGQETKIGKTLGTDLTSGKITLPLLSLLERLPENDRALLIDEVLGKRPAQLQLRLKQMNEYGVFTAVAEEVRAEVMLASQTLSHWGDLAPTALLLRLCEVLETQVGALKAK